MVKLPESSRSPLASLPAGSRPSLIWLAVVGIGRAIALVLIAEAVTRGIMALIEGTDAWRGAMTLGIGAVVVRAALEWLTEVISRRAAVGAKESLRAQLAERITASGGRDLPGGVGSLTLLATRGLDDLDGYYAQFLPALVSAAVIPPVVGARILAADWVSAVTILLTIPLVPLFMILIGLHTEERTAEALDEVSRLSDHLVELARGLPVLVGLGRAAEQTRALREIASSVHRRTMTTLRTVFLSSLALELISTISVAVVAVFIGVRLVHGSMSLETGLLALILAPECYLPLRRVGAAFHASEDGVEALTRVRRILATPLPALARAGDDAPVSPAWVVVDGLAVRYAGRTEPVVNGLSFDVPAGSIVALGGPSGSGKSTVMAAVAGLLGTTPEGATVEGAIRGIDRARIAWVPQHPEPYAPTVREEIALALEVGLDFELDGDAEIGDVLAAVGAAHLAGRSHAELSQGELRRVAMGRALARIRRGATLLLLDEPTAHLDPETAGIVQRVITSLRRRVTVLLVAHDAATRALADRVIEVGSGEVMAAPAPSSAPAEITVAASPWAATPVEDDVPLRKTWALLFELVKPLRPRFAGAIVLGALAALASIALTSLSGWLIVRASEQPPILYLMGAIVGVRFFGIGRAVLRYVQRLWMHDAILGALTAVRVRVWESLASRGPAVKRMLHGEETLDRLIGDVDRLRDLAPRVMLPPLSGVLAAVVAASALGIILPEAGLLMLVGSLVALVAAPAIALRADASSREADVALRSGVMRRFAALVAAAADLRVNGMAERARAQLATMDDEAGTLERRSAWAFGLGSAIVTLACGVTSLGMLAIGAPAVSRGEISHELLAVLVLTPLAMVEVFADVVEAVQQWPALRAVTGRFASVTSGVAPDPASGVRPEQRDPGHIHAITLDDVVARWPGAPLPAFENVSVEVRRGEWLIVTGPSGAGKSTLLSVMMGFLRPERGRYLLNGQDAASLDGARIRKRISWCPQEAHLFDSTLRGNLLLARPREDAPTDDEMRAVLRRVGLGELLARLPEGLETRIGSRGAHLSGGERQRVAIARALLTEADVVLLDEPTAHLDRESADALLTDLRAALAERVVVMVTHHLDDIAVTDHRLRLGAVQSVHQSSPGW